MSKLTTANLFEIVKTDNSTTNDRLRGQALLARDNSAANLTTFCPSDDFLPVSMRRIREAAPQLVTAAPARKLSRPVSTAQIVLPLRARQVLAELKQLISRPGAKPPLLVVEGARGLGSLVVAQKIALELATGNSDHEVNSCRSADGLPDGKSPPLHRTAQFFESASAAVEHYRAQSHDGPLTILVPPRASGELAEVFGEVFGENSILSKLSKKVKATLNLHNAVDDDCLHLKITPADYASDAIFGELVEVFCQTYDFAHLKDWHLFRKFGGDGTPGALDVTFRRLRARVDARKENPDEATVARYLADFASRNDDESTESEETSINSPNKNTLADLKLDAPSSQAIADAVDAAQAWHATGGRFDEHDEFAKRVGLTGRMVALFHGAPGTGKTFAAGCIAGQMGRPLLEINLANIVNKYVGETEKNLTQIFTEAKESGSVLFLDECDSLLEARESQDTSHAKRWVNHLLTLIASHDGVLVMATNFAANLDPAIKRRCTLVVEFKMPDEETKITLLTDCLRGAPVEPGQVLGPVVAGLPLTGSLIKLAVARAYTRARAQAGKGLIPKPVLSPGALRAAMEEVAHENGHAPARAVGF